MALSTIGSIATHIAEDFPDLPAGVSGNLVEMVDMARVEVENFTGQDIGSNSISEKFQSAILNFSKGDVVDTTYSYGAVVATSGVASVSAGLTDSFQSLKLEGLEVQEGTGGATISAMTALGGLSKQASAHFRQMGEKSIKYIGRKVRFGKSLI